MEYRILPHGGEKIGVIGMGSSVIGAQPEEEIIAAYDAVTAEEIRTLAQETFQWAQCAFSAVGKVDTEEHYHQIIHAL